MQSGKSIGMPGMRTVAGRGRNSFAARALRLAEELAFPRRCPVCDRPAPFGSLACPECEQMLARVEPPVCCRCGKPLGEGGHVGRGMHPMRGMQGAYGAGGGREGQGFRTGLRMPEGAPAWAAGGSLCRDCLRTPHVYDCGCAVYTYHSAAGSLFRFKYGGRREYGAFYGARMAERLQAWTGALPALRPDLLVPVPLSPCRQRARGYNQAEILAEEISRRTGIPMQAHALRRVENTRPLKDMTAKERQNNLKKAFQGCGNDVELKTVTLIDDIYTTGATIDACADALYRQGARRVLFLTLAIGEEMA